MKCPIETKFGVIVLYCGHKGVFNADLYVVENAVVVRSNGPVTMENLCRDESRVKIATHHFSDASGGFWRPDLGIFVVPKSEVRCLCAKCSHTSAN